ncbi:MAG: hypothetical protein KBD94_11730 [Pyrinomonadaceae bacterium]|nr:hypothetical protein [Pyrinomonadaceae bacterium]
MPPSPTARIAGRSVPTVCTVGYKYVVGFADWELELHLFDEYHSLDTA